jgi:AraC-like DNA-binding protein
VATLFDAAVHGPAQRAEAFEAQLSTASCPAAVLPETHFSGAVLDGWQLGSGVLLRLQSTGQRIYRTPQHVRIAAPERVSFAVNLAGPCVSTSRGVTTARNEHVRIVDLTSPYDIHMPSESRTHAFEIDCAALGLPPDLVRAAVPHVRASPIHDLLRDHLRVLPVVAEQAPHALSSLGMATTQLARAVLASIAPEGSLTRHVRLDTQLATVDAYIAQHLSDPDLTPARIAAATFISLRQLYKLFEHRPFPPGEWILRERLEAARLELLRSNVDGGRIAVIARRWGFSNPAHFAKRFRAAYGLSPTEWLRLRQAVGP